MEKFNYFKTIEDKYKNKISLKRPLVLRLDGKGITKNPFINLLDESPGSFSDSLKKTAKFIASKYRCITYVATDEINVVFVEPDFICSKLNTTDIQKINSLVSQEIFYMFNKYMGTVNPVYFDCRCFNIPEHKVGSYIKYRVKSAVNVSVNYFAKKHMEKEDRHGKPLIHIENYLKQNIPSFKERTIYAKEGFIFIKNKKIIPSKYINA